MAKRWTNNVMVLDTQGNGFNGRASRDYTTNANGTWTTNPATQLASTQTKVNSITVDPSAGSWVVVLSDTAGNVVFTQKGAAATGGTFEGLWFFDGVVATTLTNITRVVLSTESVQW